MTWERGARRDAVFLSCLVVVLLPFAVGLVRVLFLHWTPVGDWALLELRTRSVGGSHTPLVGPYSRFGWSHPGPALFFALAIPYRLLGSRPDGLLVCALLVNSASAAGIVCLAWRRGRRPLTVGTAIALAVLCRTLGAEFLRDPWNPYVTVLPFLALVFVMWSIACGDTWLLPVAALIASFIVQSHLGYAVLVVVVLIVAIAWRLMLGLVRRLRNRGGVDRPPLNVRRTMAISGVTVAVVVVSWLPPLVDQIVNPGNLQAISKFFGKQQPTPTNDTAVRLVGRALAFPAAWVTGHDVVQTSDFTASSTGFFVPVAALLLLAGVAVALRRRDRDAVALLGLVFATLVAAVYSVSRVAGPLAAYLVRWLLALGMLSWLAGLWALWPSSTRVRLNRGARVVLATAVAAALLVPTVASIDDAVRNQGPWYRAGVVEQRLARDAVAKLHTGGRPVLLETSRDNRWWTWGLAPRLEAAGISVAASPGDVLYFGRHRVARRGAARFAVVVRVGAGALTSDRPAGGRLLASYIGRPQPGPVIGAVADYSTVIHAAALGLLVDNVAVYEVPL